MPRFRSFPRSSAVRRFSPVRRWITLSCLAATFCLPAGLTPLGPGAARADQATKEKAAKEKPAEEPKAADRQEGEAEKNQDSKNQDSKNQEKKTIGIAQITLKGDYTEGVRAAGLFGQLEESLREGLERLEKAGNDSRVSAIVLHIDEPELGWGQVHEFRVAIKTLRDKGKKVYAWSSSADNKTYLLAAGCDKVYLPKPGMLAVFGLRAEVTFYKNLFDMLAIEPEILRVGEFKSAAEPFTRTEMSKEFRLEMEELLDDLYSNMVSGIAEGRGMKKEAVEAAINSGPLSATKAKEAGLIDGFAYEDEITDLVKKDMGATDAKIGKNYGKKKIETDFSGLTGLIEFMNLLAGVEQPTAEAAGNKIALISAAGAITTGKSESDLFGSSTLGSETLIKAIEKARDDETVKAIVLRVDSPGGSAIASDLMWHALEVAQKKKPVIASMGNYAASGGYYISMGADAIVAEPSTITGSIGVVGGKIAIEGLLNKVGITTSVVTRGDNSGAFSALSGFSESERKAMQALMLDIYDQFTSKAAEGRGMPVEKLEKLARGRVYTGTRAKELGLVDEVGTLETAVELAKAKARERGLLGKDEETTILPLPKPVSPLEQLFGPLDPEASAALIGAGATDRLLLNTLPPEAIEILSELSVVNRLTRERTLLLMPFRVRIK